MLRIYKFFFKYTIFLPLTNKKTGKKANSFLSRDCGLNLQWQAFLKRLLRETPY
jgi:hypothetical protein